MSDRIFDPTIGSLNTALNLRLLRQNVIASNVANADTPNYKSKELDFENSLRAALKIDGHVSPVATHPEHRVPRSTDPVGVMVFEEANGVESLDGNTVDRAAEMAKMAENQLLYDASIEMLRKKLGMLKYAVNDGGGGN